MDHIKKILEAIENARYKLYRMKQIPKNYEAMKDLIIQIDNLKSMLEDLAKENSNAYEYAKLCM